MDSTDTTHLLEYVAEEYAHATVQLCIDRGVNLEHLADDFALVIGMLQEAAVDAEKVGNAYVMNIAQEGYSLLCSAAQHFPKQTPRLTKVLARSSRSGARPDAR